MTRVSSMRQVRNNQVPKPRAMVEDILTRVTLLDGELSRYTGQPAQSVCLASPRASGGPVARPQLDSPRPATGRTEPPPPRTAQVSRRTLASALYCWEFAWNRSCFPFAVLDQIPTIYRAPDQGLAI